MEWGTVCEDCARVSYLKFLTDLCYDFTVLETGLWKIKYKDTDMKNKQNKPLKPEKQKRILHCSKCRRPLVICNQDKCIDKRNSACAKKSQFKDDTKNTQLNSKQLQVSLLFCSYVSGSNNVTNSCKKNHLIDL